MGVADHALGVQAGHHLEVVALPGAAVVELEGAEQGQGGVGEFVGVVGMGMGISTGERGECHFTAENLRALFHT